MYSLSVFTDKDDVTTNVENGFLEFEPGRKTMLLLIDDTEASFDKVLKVVAETNPAKYRSVFPVQPRDINERVNKEIAERIEKALLSGLVKVQVEKIVKDPAAFAKGVFIGEVVAIALMLISIFIFR